jgi:hypothetical protein
MLRSARHIRVDKRMTKIEVYPIERAGYVVVTIRTADPRYPMVDTVIHMGLQQATSLMDMIEGAIVAIQEYDARQHKLDLPKT